MNPSIQKKDAELYDVIVPDWPGELDFYGALAAEAGAVLEVACGTGRLAVRLAQSGARVVGVDLSEAMLAVARAKSADLPGARWLAGDMLSFDAGESFPLIIVPGHSFQFMLTPQDQLACLLNLKRHAAPGGRLVIHLDHQDVSWLGDLRAGKGGVFEAAGEAVHPVTGQRIRTRRAWAYELATQTAITSAVREAVDAAGQVVERWEIGPTRLHCVFRFEMEHLVARAGLTVEAVYGDFARGPLQDTSTEMVWVLRRGHE